MKCPICSNINHNELDLHSDGYAKDMIECSACGTIWLDVYGRADVIKASNEKVSYPAARY